MTSAEPQRADDLTLAEAIARYAREELNLVLPLDGFRPELLPAHLAMNFLVVDEHGRQLAMGRNLAQLRAELGEQAGEQFSAIAQPKAALSGITGWNFGELQEIMEIRQGAQTLIGYPALVDRGDSVDLEVLDAPQKARELHRDGLRRLFMLQLKEQTKYLEKNLPGLRDLGMQFLPFGDAASLKDQLLRVTFDRACMAEPLPATQAQFLQALRRGEDAAHAAGPGNLPPRRQHTRRVSGAAEETAGAEEFSAGAARDRGAARASAAEELHRRHGLGAAAAFRALPQGGGAAPGQAARRPGARCALERRVQSAVADLAARRAEAKKTRRGRSATGAVPLAAGGTARVAVRAGIAHAGAGVGEAAAENVASYAKMRRESPVTWRKRCLSAP